MNEQMETESSADYAFGGVAKTKRARPVALVTGGSSGLGLEMARQLSARGYDVIICGRDTDRLEAAAHANPPLRAFRCDVTKASDRRALFGHIFESHRSLSLLVNNAGITEPCSLTRSGNLEDRFEREWRTNYLAPVLLARELYPLLVRCRGTVVNVTSGLAYLPLPIEAGYCATKAALHSMTQSMRYQFAEDGIRVVEILYPAVRTQLYKGFVPKQAIEASEAVGVALRAMDKGLDEIRVKLAGVLYWLHRLAPALATRLMEKNIPKDISALIESWDDECGSGRGVER